MKLFVIFGWNSNYTNSVCSFAYSGFAGVSYYFKDKLAAFAEVGYGIAAIEIGISFKF